MSNVEKAAQVIRDLSEVDGETIGYAHAHNIATYLADAGLLMPDLLGPDRENDREGAVWYLNTQIGYIASGGAVIDAYGLSHQRQSFRLTLTKEEAEVTAHGFLAAAKYQEEE